MKNLNLTKEEKKKIVKETSEIIAINLKMITGIRKICDESILIKLKNICNNYGELKLLISEIQREQSWGHKDSTIGERLMKILDEEIDSIEFKKEEV